MPFRHDEQVGIVAPSTFFLPVSDPRLVANRFLPFMRDIDRHGIVRNVTDGAQIFALNRFAIQIELLANQLDLIAWQTNQTLDHDAARMRMLEHNHIAALGCAGKNPALGQRNEAPHRKRQRIAVIAIGEFCHSNPVGYL